MADKGPALVEFAEDLEQMKKEYAGFLQSIEEVDSRKAIITTKEGHVLTVEHTGPQMWMLHDVKPSDDYADKETLEAMKGKRFEGAEGLLSETSPEFRACFSARLSQRLKEILQYEASS